MPPDPCLYLRGLRLRGWRETGEGGEKVKGKKGERWGGIWPTPKFWCGTPYHIIVQLFKSILGLAPLGLDPMHIHEPRG